MPKRQNSKTNSIKPADLPLRISVCGAVGVGKSSLIKRLNLSEVAFESIAEFAEPLNHLQFEQLLSTELLILAIDAEVGIDDVAKRSICAGLLMGIRNIILCVNKMDLVNYDLNLFGGIALEFETYCEKLIDQACLDDPKPKFYSIPINAEEGGNIASQLSKDDSYRGVNLQQLISGMQKNPATLEDNPLRMRITEASFDPESGSQISGNITSGVAKFGEKIVVLPSAVTGIITKITSGSGTMDVAYPGERIMLNTEKLLPASKGDMVCDARDRVQVADQFEALIISTSSNPVLPARPYEFCLEGGVSTANISDLKYVFDVHSLEKLAANELKHGDISVCNISIDRKIPYEAFGLNPQGSLFSLVDQSTGETIATGVINFALYRSQNVHWQSLDVTRNTRAQLKGQKPVLLWFTGLSGSGKSTIANIIDKQLSAMGRHTFTLDGDNVRLGLNKDLGFTDVDRVENIRRIGEVAKLMSDAGLITLVSFISPFRTERQLARNMVGEGEFLEIHVSTPLEVAEARDIKGLYKKARAGEIKNFTGIDSPYEVPQNPEIVVDTSVMSAEECADIIVEELKQRAII